MGDLKQRLSRIGDNITNIVRKDFADARKNPIVVLVLIALIVLPSLYGLINIYACWDPYENTGDVQFAIANEDKGATYEDVKINVGNDLVTILKNNSNFNWVFLTSDELREGVHNGTYYAGMIVPANFSESIVSITTDNPQSAKLEYIVNEKSNPVAAKLSDAGAKEVYNTINAEIVTFINIAAYDKLGELQSSLASGASQLSSGGAMLSSGASQVASGGSQLASGANQLADGADQLSQANGQIAQGAGDLSQGTHQAKEKVDTVVDKIDKVTQTIRDHTSSEIIKEATYYIDAKTGEVRYNVTRLDDGASLIADGSGQAALGAAALSDGAFKLSDGTLSLVAGAELLANSAASALFTASSSLSLAANGLADVTGLSDEQIGDYFYAPVKLDRHEEFSTNNFGSQVAPFYVVLSMWVGAIITCVLLNVGSSIGTPYRPQEMYLGRLVVFNVMAILQTTVTMIGAFVLGIDVCNPVVYVLTCYFVSIIFMAVMYSLVSLFGDVGKGIAIILLVFQISGTGGIYPIEIMSSIFRTLYPYLPMTYGINIVREAQLGLIWANYIPSFLILLGFGVCVVLAAIILKRSFDKHTKYFEEKLDESDLFN